MLEAKIFDAINLCELRQKPHFVGFLTDEEKDKAELLLKKSHFSNYMFYGGHDSAERLCFGAFPTGYEPSPSDFPINALCFSYNKKYKTLTHRDFLGAVMSCGVTRDSVGDILVEEGRGVLFVRSSVSDFLKEQIDKVGSVGVEITDAKSDDLPSVKKAEEIIITVSSLRVDNIVASLANLSRENTSKLISQGLVFLNSQEVLSVSTKVKEGDKLTIRKKGKYIINSILGVSKKGKTRVLVNHYR